jgi:prepilin-type N-terminal cleavage/methylation domain-containing protein
LNGICTVAEHPKPGLSLIEVLVTIAIGAIVIGVVSSSFPGLNRLAGRFLSQTTFEAEYLIFLLKLEDEYRQATLQTEGDRQQLDQMVFRRNLNPTQSEGESGDRIAYRWNVKERRIDRKSGDGYFQALLDGVSAFTWRRTTTNPLCHRLEVRDVFTPPARAVLFCR